MKKILILSNEKNISNVLVDIVKESGFAIDITGNISEAVGLYNSNDYFAVIIKYDEKHLVELSDRFKEKDQKQSMVVISDLPICSEVCGCDECCENFNIWKISIKEIKFIPCFLNNIKEEKCINANRFNEFFNFRDIIIKLGINEKVYYNNLRVGIDNLHIIPNKVHESYLFYNELISMVDVIKNDRHFDCEVEVDKKIVIYPS